MPNNKKDDRDDIKRNAGLSLSEKTIKQLDGDVKKFGYKSRSALLETFFEKQYPAFLYWLMATKSPGK